MSNCWALSLEGLYAAKMIRVTNYISFLRGLYNFLYDRYKWYNTKIMREKIKKLVNLNSLKLKMMTAATTTFSSKKWKSNSKCGRQNFWSAEWSGTRSFRKDVEKLESSYIAVGNTNWYSCFKRHLAILRRLNLDLSYCTTIEWENE